MTKPELEKLAFDHPNDFELGEKIRQIASDDSEAEPDDIKESTRWKDLYLRQVADFDNFRKRTNKEKEEIVFRTRQSMLDSILDIDSDISLASKHIKDEGIQIIIAKLDKFLTNHGVEVIQTDTYDSDIHDVISVVDSNTKGIVDVVSKGYKLGDRILRHPKVIISK